MNTHCLSQKQVNQSLMMADFTGDIENLKPSFSEMNSNMELIHNLSAYEFIAFSNDHQQHQLLMNFTQNGQSSFDPSSPSTPLDQSLPSGSEHGHENKKEKSLRGSKRKRKNEKIEEKPSTVIHVRAKRGQATDSHSLAERARREKINEKLRCLQGLVPGCYKTMGMAVMLDVIIKYVKSLQNQIEFLSMKLSAASSSYDLNSPEKDVMLTSQGTNVYEAREIERMIEN